MGKKQDIEEDKGSTNVAAAVGEKAHLGMKQC